MTPGRFFFVGRTGQPQEIEVFCLLDRFTLSVD
jgi:hypothetical protein